MNSTPGEYRNVRVAAVQLHSCLGQIEANLARASDLVAEAARAGAGLIVLPELAASGYSLSRAVWDAAERQDGPTVQWLRATSQHLGVHLGIGFVEADGDDFYNTYALGTPDGLIAGFVRKTMAETALFRCETGSHVVETELGRIGIGICADNHFAPMVRLMQGQGVDVMLMPHAVPAAFKTGGLVSDADIASAYAKMRDMAPLYARLLGIPAIFANQVGPRGPEHWLGMLGSLMPADQFRFVGLSTVAERDGAVVAQLDDHSEGVAVGQVRLGRSPEALSEPVTYGRYGGGWLHAAASGNVPRDILCGADAFFGRLAYNLSGNRRRRAREVSPGPWATSASDREHRPTATV